MASAARILSDALALPIDERAKVVRELLRSLDEGEDDAAADAWTRELRGRLEDLESGRAQGLTLDEVKAMMTARRAARRTGA